MPLYIALIWVFCLMDIRPFVTYVYLLIVYALMIVFFSRHGIVYPINSAGMMFITIVVVSTVRYRRGLHDVGNEIRLEGMNEELNRSSRTDALTGLKNRYALRRDFESYTGRKISVTIADIDNFKQYNDTYGHEMGDSILKAFGTVVVRLWSYESCYRYGGDEFLIITDMNDMEAVVRQEHFKKLMAEYAPKELPEDPTCSSGTVSGYCKDNEALREMLRGADRNLYRAKEQGRDQSVVTRYEGKTGHAAEDRR